MKPVPGIEGELPADLVLLAMGFSGPVEDDLVKELALPWSRAAASRAWMPTSANTGCAAADKIFVAGDIRRGQTLVVWAIREGRQAAHSIDRFLMGRTDLPR